MIVFKLSWAPWLLIIAGILVATSDPTGLVLTVAGVIWLLLKARNKNQAKSGDVASSAQSFKSQQGDKPVGDVTNYCPHCGKPAESDFAFCSNCGSKLNIK